LPSKGWNVKLGIESRYYKVRGGTLAHTDHRCTLTRHQIFLYTYIARLPCTFFGSALCGRYPRDEVPTGLQRCASTRVFGTLSLPNTNDTYPDERAGEVPEEKDPATPPARREPAAPKRSNPRAVPAERSSHWVTEVHINARIRHAFAPKYKRHLPRRACW